MRLVAGFIAALVLGTALAFAQEAAPFPGHAAPPFTAQLADGRSLTLADFHRSAAVVVLHFWGVT
jgi:hypothetical protein